MTCLSLASELRRKDAFGTPPLLVLVLPRSKYLVRYFYLYLLELSTSTTMVLILHVHDYSSTLCPTTTTPRQSPCLKSRIKDARLPIAIGYWIVSSYHKIIFVPRTALHSVNTTTPTSHKTRRCLTKLTNRQSLPPLPP